MSEARVLITGAAGFIGRHVLAAIQRDWPAAAVISLDLKLDQGQGVDLLDADSVTRFVRKTHPTHVVHAAGCHGRASARDAFLLHCVATQNLLDAIAAAGSEVRFANVGSSAQYGRQDPRTEPELEETHVDRPESAYAVSKGAQEALVSVAASKAIIRPIYLRLFNPIGPGQVGPFLLPTMVRQLRALPKTGGVLELKAIDPARDYVDIRDAGEAIVAALRAHGLDGERVNVCSGTATSVGALVRALARIAARDVTVRATSSAPSAGEIPYQRGSRKKIAAHTGWLPRYDLDASLADIWKEGEA